MAGETTHRLGPYHVTVTDAYGPRVVGLRRHDGPQVLADLPPDVSIEGPQGTFRFHGGHRLWSAPEVPRLSYAPDDHHCEVAVDDETVTISGPVDVAGFAKSISVRSHGDRLMVDHRLRWEGDGTVRTAPWAITLLPLGGVAVVPVGGFDRHDDIRADRSVVLWPYTELTDPRLSWRQATVTIEARGGPRLKVGTGPAPRRLGYLRDGLLFTKTVAPAGDGDRPDLGAVGQVFTNEVICELETLGPLVELAPGDDIAHQETWQVVECPDLDTALTLL